MQDPGSARQQYGDLKRKLAWRAADSSGDRILRVFVDQNNRCNLRCRMCGFSDPRVGALPKYDMPRELFDSIARQVFPRTNRLILACFAEPFMTRDFPDRLAAVREMGVPYSEIITNGTLLQEASLRKVFDAGITGLTVSVDGGTKQVYEAIRKDATFQVVMYNISLFQSMRKNRGLTSPWLQINHVLSELNIDHFNEFLSLVRRIRPERVCIRTVSRMSNASVQPTEDPAFWERVAEARSTLEAFCGETGIDDAGFLRDRPGIIDLSGSDGEALTCQVPFENLAIFPNGDVYPCIGWNRAPIGNLRRQTFEEIWEGNELKALREEFGQRKPGLDCLNCGIRMADPSDADDLFYTKVAAPATGAAR